MNVVESVDHMRKYYRAAEMLYSYDPKDEEQICELVAIKHPSEIHCTWSHKEGFYDPQ